MDGPLSRVSHTLLGTVRERRFRYFRRLVTQGYQGAQRLYFSFISLLIEDNYSSSCCRDRSGGRFAKTLTREEGEVKTEGERRIKSLALDFSAARLIFS